MDEKQQNQASEEPSGSWSSRSSLGRSLPPLVTTLGAYALAWRIAELIHSDKDIPPGWRLAGMIGMAIAALLERPSLGRAVTAALPMLGRGNGK